MVKLWLVFSGITFFCQFVYQKKFSNLEDEEEEGDRAAFSMSRRFDDASMMGH